MRKLWKKQKPPEELLKKLWKPEKHIVFLKKPLKNEPTIFMVKVDNNGNPISSTMHVEDVQDLTVGFHLRIGVYLMIRDEIFFRVVTC